MDTRRVAISIQADRNYFQVKNAGGVPHTGKYFGMGRDDNGLIRPFMNVGPHDVFSVNQKEEFRAYADKVDPVHLFW